MCRMFWCFADLIIMFLEFLGFNFNSLPSPMKIVKCVVCDPVCFCLLGYVLFCFYFDLSFIIFEHADRLY